DRYALIPQRGIDRGAVARDREAVDPAGIGDRDREVRQPGLECSGAATRLGFALGVAAALRNRRGLAKVSPRGRELLVPFATVGEVEQRTGARLEAIARLELVACLGDLAFLEQLLALLEQHLGFDRLRARRRGGGDNTGDDERSTQGRAGSEAR